MLWERKKSAVPEKKEEQGKTAENLTTRITKGLNAEMGKAEEPIKIEGNLHKSHKGNKVCQGTKII